MGPPQHVLVLVHVHVQLQPMHESPVCEVGVSGGFVSWCVRWVCQGVLGELVKVYVDGKSHSVLSISWSSYMSLKSSSITPRSSSIAT